MLDLYKQSFKSIERKVGGCFSHLPLSPNHYTLISIIFAFGSFYFLLKENFILTIVFFLIAGLLDFIDGAVARYKNMVTKVGGYLDTITDRYVEGILLLGMLFLPLPKIFIPAYAWIFLILFGSIMTTYSKAAAKEKDLVNQELKGGILSRGERIILLLISLVLAIFNYYWTTYLLILMAILTNITAFQRIFSAIRKNING
jgi:archaetidylinositol phosphate synthase